MSQRRRPSIQSPSIQSLRRDQKKLDLAGADGDNPTGNTNASILKPSKGFGLRAILLCSYALLFVSVAIAFYPSTSPVSLSDRRPKRSPSQNTLAKTLPFALPSVPREIDIQVEKEDLLTRLDESVLAFPDNSSLHHVIALTCVELTQTEKAETHFKLARRLNFSSPSIGVGYAKLLSQLGKPEEAVDLLTDLFNRGMITEELLDELGNTHLQRGEVENAYRILADAHLKYPKNNSILLHLAQCEVQKDMFVEARDHAQRLLELGQKDSAVYMTLSTALIRLGEREKALEVRKQQAAATPKKPSEDEAYQQSFREFACHSYMMLGNCLIEQKEWEQGEQWLLYGLRLSPAYKPSLISLGEFLRKRGRIQDSIKVHSRLCEMEPENPVALNNLASLAATAKLLPLAESSLRRAAALDMTGVSSLRFAQYAMQRPDYLVAERFARDAMQKSQSEESYSLLISILQSMGRLSEANALRELAMQKFPSSKLNSN